MAQSDYGMRGEAAGRMMKKKGQPPLPEEDELGMPPEDDSAPALTEGGGPPPDLAALLGGGANPDAPMEEAPPGEPQAMDFESAIGAVEASLEGMPPEQAEEIRVHLNAAREIAARGNIQGMAQQPMASPGEAPPPVAASPGQKEIGG